MGTNKKDNTVLFYTRTVKYAREKNKEETMEERTIAALIEMGIPANLKGFDYISTNGNLLACLYRKLKLMELKKREQEK